MSEHKDLIDKVKSGRFSEQELINLYRNAEERDAVEVLEAIKLHMRAKFPRAANRIFGAKQTDAQIKLEGVLARLSEKFDLAKNRVGSRVKAGGEMLSGNLYLDLYISYKNENQDGAALALTQDSVDSELVVNVQRYKTGQGAFRTEKKFTMDDFPLAEAEYEEHLKGILLVA